jgi:hypothetical protein
VIACAYAAGEVQLPYAGGGREATAPPAPPARGFAPWNPDLMRSLAERLAYMPMGTYKQAAMTR